MRLVNITKEESDWYVALVDFIRAEQNPDTQEIIPNDCLGAVGWMGVLANEHDEVDALISSSLSEIGLHVVSIEDIQPLLDVESLDDHLAKNLDCRPRGDPLVVWGTLHCYLAEGEA